MRWDWEQLDRNRHKTLLSAVYSSIKCKNDLKSVYVTAIELEVCF